MPFDVSPEEFAEKVSQTPAQPPVSEEMNGQLVVITEDMITSDEPTFADVLRLIQETSTAAVQQHFNQVAADMRREALTFSTR